MLWQRNNNCDKCHCRVNWRNTYVASSNIEIVIYFRVLQVVQWRLLSFSTAMLRGVEIIIKFMSALYNIDGSKRHIVDIPIYFQMRRGGDQGRASSVINLFESLRLFWFLGYWFRLIEFLLYYKIVSLE